MPARRESNLLLCKPLDTIPDDVDSLITRIHQSIDGPNFLKHSTTASMQSTSFARTSLIARIQFQYGLSIGIANQLSRETEDRSCLANTWHPGNNQMWHVPISGNNFEPFDSFRVANNIVQDVRPVLFDPTLVN